MKRYNLQTKLNKFVPKKIFEINFCLVSFWQMLFCCMSFWHYYERQYPVSKSHFAQSHSVVTLQNAFLFSFCCHSAIILMSFFTLPLYLLPLFFMSICWMLQPYPGIFFFKGSSSFFKVWKVHFSKCLQNYFGNWSTNRSISI